MLSVFLSNIMHIIGVEDKTKWAKNQNVLKIYMEVNVKEKDLIHHSWRENRSIKKIKLCNLKITDVILIWKFSLEKK